MKPTIHLTNWSSRKLHGPGRRWTIMVLPREWEHGDGRVQLLQPEAHDLRAVKAGRMTPADYERTFRQHLAIVQEDMEPGRLHATEGGGLPPVLTPVRDGDTLLCACSKAEAAAGRCHRVWAAEALVRAGWRVVLDGCELPEVPQC